VNLVDGEMVFDFDVEIEATNQCNTGCVYCPHESFLFGREKKGFLIDPGSAGRQERTLFQ
jgi:2-iminoacetate synthase ThiH